VCCANYHIAACANEHALTLRRYITATYVVVYTANMAAVIIVGRMTSLSPLEKCNTIKHKTNKKVEPKIKIIPADRRANANMALRIAVCRFSCVKFS